MKKILHILSSPRGAASVSIQLGNAIVEKIKAAYPGSTVTERDLVNEHFPHLEESHLASFFTPPDARTPEHVEAVKHSDQAIQEIKDADIIVIGAPMYNFSIHSALKAWLDHVVRSGQTFKVEGHTATGLVTGKKVYVAISSGFVYSDGPMKSMDFIEPYLRSMLGFIGMTDVDFVRAEGTNVPDLKDNALEKGIDSVMVA
ncbi:FMN-dependent NADH-azoreductase [Mucilaginibacter pedocola]|uniref:FMN dependent NADH:quinone oxidoreductase n=1 Tax=Mucilaginibacter pedocola TaxID=1792845 RepID=A0A1S9PHV3_9SPHI|nr:NAD(P)H-dependent oxidoreductase [Mucilaginibacter pedocola]OOQ60531.1 FMN-dependent NADH-azoreductase [Mucilaginibacter pedocola]